MYTVDIRILKGLGILRYRGSRAGNSVRNRRHRRTEEHKISNYSYLTRESTCMTDYEG